MGIHFTDFGLMTYEMINIHYFVEFISTWHTCELFREIIFVTILLGCWRHLQLGFMSNSKVLCFGKCGASSNVMHLMQLEGTKFEGIDLYGDEFADYDEKGECPVMISNPRATFNVVK